MGRIKRYFATEYGARQYLEELQKNRKWTWTCPHDFSSWGVYLQPKGTKHHDMYYIGPYLEWLNFAN